MARPAEKRRRVAVVLDVPEAEVLTRLRQLVEASSYRLLAAYLTTRGIPISKSWLHHELSKPRKGRMP